MNATENIKHIIENKTREQFSDTLTDITSSADNRLHITIDRQSIVAVSNKMITLGGRYLVGTAFDNIERDGTLGIIHSFAFDSDNLIVNVQTAVPENDPVCDSITPDIPGAGWSEREFADLLGITFTNHPKPKRLVLADDWPEGIYPLRKEVPHNLVPPAAEDVAYELDKNPEGSTVIPIGPFHASLHEPEHFAVYVDGETIKGCDYRGFMTHRGIEKLCQTQVSYNEVPFIAERICGICGSVHATAYSQAVEMAAGITISRRAEFIRTIMLEIERLHSHLLWLGVAGHLIGFDTIFMQAWRIREHIMWLSERITGNRKTYGMIIIGGSRKDITQDIATDMRNILTQVEKEVMTVQKAIIRDSAIHKRTKGVGYISKEEAIRWSLVGPVARARGINIDVRKDHTYAAYDEIDFDVPVYDGCDVWSTLRVRVDEIFESIKIINTALDIMPNDGPVLTELTEEIPPLRHAISTVEAPRGEAVHYVITGEEDRPDRWRVRAPTYPNLQGVPSMLLNNQFADFPIIVGSIDPCFSCTDRVLKVNIGNGDSMSVSREEIENNSRKRKRSIG